MLIDHLFIIDDSFAEAWGSSFRVDLEHHRGGPSLSSKITSHEHTVALNVSSNGLAHTHMALFLRLRRSCENCAVSLMDFVVRIPCRAVLGKNLIDALLDDLLLDVDVIDEGSILFDRVERILLRRGQIFA